MLWIFERANQTLHIETRYDNESHDFVLVIHGPDGKEQIERFPDTMTFQMRLEALEQDLAAQRWNRTKVEPLSDGWRLA